MSGASDEAPPYGADARVEKLMSLSRAEFELSIARVGRSQKIGEGHYQFGSGAGTVDVIYQPLPGKTFGGLLTLPRALVALVFHGVDAAARTAFVARFDDTFRRGGG